MHYYQFNIADYRADTAHLSIIEHGIYRQLMDWYYLDEKPIPKETQVVMRRLSLGSDMVHLLENVLSDYFILTDSGYFHGRIEQELEKYHMQFAKNRVNGQQGGRPKKTQVVNEKKPKKTQVVSENNPSAPLTNNQELITNNHITTLSKNSREFDEFWNRYPKKVGKASALKSWIKVNPRIDDVMFALSWQTVSDQWQRDGGQYIPNPATYINQGRWQDEPLRIEEVTF